MHLDGASVHLGSTDIDNTTIRQDNVGMNNKIFVVAGGLYGPNNPLAEGNTIIQGDRTNVGNFIKFRDRDGKEIISQSYNLGNRAWFENAHRNSLTQGISNDSVYIERNVVGNTINQGKGDDYLDITPYQSSRDNIFDGGEGTNRLRLRGNREDYRFTFQPDGSFTAVHTPTKADVGTFRNYQNVMFGESTNYIPIATIRTEEEARRAIEEVKPAAVPTRGTEGNGVETLKKPADPTTDKEHGRK